jgi:hypothetical protein
MVKFLRIHLSAREYQPNLQDGTLLRIQADELCGDLDD